MGVVNIVKVYGYGLEDSINIERGLSLRAKIEMGHKIIDCTTSRTLTVVMLYSPKNRDYSVKV